MIPTLTLPHPDLRVSHLCLGTSSYGTEVSGAAADRLTAAFLEAGGNFFDTAHCYAFWKPNGLGASERELGASLRRLGNPPAVVATKGGHPDNGPDYRRPADFLSETVIEQDVTESLERLGRDTIDLYYLHRDDGRTPVGEVMERLNRQVQRGRLRYLGASNWSAARIRAANEYAREHGLSPFVASQIQGSLAEPGWRPGPDPTTRYLTPEERGAGVPLVCYSATAGGYFAGKGGEQSSYANPANQARRERACALATEFGCTPTQVALAWLRCQPGTVIPLFGTVNPEHLAEACASAAVALSPEQVRWLRDG